MRRPRFRKTPTQVSLFPFLAVLICTMGGLIVLLVMVVQQARVDAQTVAETRRQQAADSAGMQQLQQERDDHTWRQDVLRRQRVEKTDELSDRRLELGHLEEHLRELEDRWKQLKQEAELARSLQEEKGRDGAALEAEIERLEDAIAKSKDELEKARERTAEKPRSYTIVPYRGPNGTQRRPIYLECTAQGVRVQPAGLLLTLNDFQGPLGPGNPLDAALRAIREYWNRTPVAEGEPYPLLLVRPDGVDAYAAARAALKAWDDEFGYELVEADMPLKFPPEDAALAPLLDQTVQVARERQRRLAAAMPSRFNRRSTTAGFVATRDGLVPLSGSSPSRPGRGVGRGRGGPGVGSGAAGGRSGAAGGGFYPDSMPGATATGSTAANAMPSGANPAGTNPAGTNPAGTNPSGNSSDPGRSTGDQRFAGGTGREPNANGTGRRGSGQNQTSSAQASGAASRSSAASGGSAGGSGSSSGGPTGGSAAAGHYQPGRAGSLSGGSAMGGMASSRGSDWALPRSNRNATGVTRPMNIACYPDRLVILPDRGDRRPPRAILLPQKTASGVDAFVSAVWEVMDGWGIALAGGYWKPILRVDVQPGAESRFRDLQILLKDSGLVVERKQR